MGKAYINIFKNKTIPILITGVVSFGKSLITLYNLYITIIFYNGK